MILKRHRTHSLVQSLIILPFFLILACPLHAQSDSSAIIAFLRSQAKELTAPNMHGRGYVQNGREIAADYIQNKFREFGLRPPGNQSNYYQSYRFPVNTFPGSMQLSINGKLLKPGGDYIIDAGSSSFSAKNLPVKKVDMSSISDIERLKNKLRQFDGTEAYLLTNTDSMCKALGVHFEEIATVLPPACYIVPEKKKLTWTVSCTQNPATLFYVIDSVLPSAITTANVNVKAVLLKETENKNIIATVPGMVKDSFIAFSAHYDHLGRMGSETYFPGASDNGSGISALLYLAGYFAAHPPHYSVLFIAFSGEEAGLLGSQYYVAHPSIPLANIKFLTNVDIMGDATDGVTVVNASVLKKQLNQLQKINDQQRYLPVIKSRGKAQNSDHYFFTEAGVPSFFMYSNGGTGFYHDIFDVADELTLRNIPGAVHLLIDFAEKYTD